MDYVSGVDRAQQVLFPEVLDEYVGADNQVRVIDAYVGSLDLQGLGFERASPKQVGPACPATPPTTSSSRRGQSEMTTRSSTACYSAFRTRPPRASVLSRLGSLARNH